MRLIDFLILLLQTQAYTLQKLAGIFGEEELLEMLEITGEKSPLLEKQIFIDPQWFTPPPPDPIQLRKSTRLPSKTPPASAYAELEGAVHELQLSAVLEFHLWAYPFYRVIIESPVDLRSFIQPVDHGESLIHLALEQAQIWIKHLPLPPEHSRKIEQSAVAPWLRFRSELFKKLGHKLVRHS
jgi:hypothetical protein